MFRQIEEIMRHHPAAQCGRLWRPESSFSAYERLERKPFRRSPAPAPRPDRLSFGGGLALLIALLIVMYVPLAL